MPPALAIGGAALLGGAAGAIPKKSSQSTTSGVNLGDASALEKAGVGYQTGAAKDFASFVGAGPGQQDVTSSLGAQRGLADLLNQYAQSGGLPSEADITSSNQIAGQLFQGQRTALDQSFADQTTAANRQAALLGRSVNDPILQAKLRTEQMRQSSQLAANQGSWAQQFALNQPLQRLGFAQQRAGVLQGLASQAMANRQQLAAMGEALMTNERNFRLATAKRWSNQQTQSGGGIGGFLTGALAGAGTGMSVANSAQGMGLFGGTSSPAPSPSTFMGGGTGLQNNLFGAWGGGYGSGGAGRGMTPFAGD